MTDNKDNNQPNTIKVIHDKIHEMLFYEIDTGEETVFIIPVLEGKSDEKEI